MRMLNWRKRSRVMILSGLLLCSSTWLTGCFGTKPDLLPLEDSNVPIPEIYTKEGVRIEGYQGYSDGFIIRTMKFCDAFLDEKGIQ